VFQPDPFSGRSLDEIISYIEIQFQKLANLFSDLEAESIRFTIMYKEPERPQEGMLVYADGTLWNPGYGKGLYVYLSGWEPVTNVTGLQTRINQGYLTLTSYAPTVSNG